MFTVISYVGMIQFFDIEKVNILDSCFLVAFNSGSAWLAKQNRQIMLDHVPSVLKTYFVES